MADSQPMASCIGQSAQSIRLHRAEQPCHEGVQRPKFAFASELIWSKYNIPPHLQKPHFQKINSLTKKSTCSAVWQKGKKRLTNNWQTKWLVKEIPSCWLLCLNGNKNWCCAWLLHQAKPSQVQHMCVRRQILDTLPFCILSLKQFHWPLKKENKRKQKKYSHLFLFGTIFRLCCNLSHTPCHLLTAKRQSKPAYFKV